MTDLQPMEGIPFMQQPHPYRVQEHAKVITGFVMAYTDLHPDEISVPDAIRWFIQHDTNLQSENPAVVAEVTLRVRQQLRVSRQAVLHLIRLDNFYTDAEARDMVDMLPDADPASYIVTRAGLIRWDGSANTRGYHLENS